MWGHLIGVGLVGDHAGSIPVCTGLPLRGEGAVLPVEVYPRVYGATRAVISPPSSTKGLSPRM